MRIFRLAPASVLILVSVLLCLACGSTEVNDTTDTSSTSALILAADSADSTCVDLIGEDSVSVLDLLKREHEVATKSSIMGIFVSGIDSLHNSRDAFWLFSVNDTMPQASCDEAITRTGDKVTWHYRKIE